MQKNRNSGLLLALQKSLESKVPYPALRDIEYNSRTWQSVCEEYKAANKTARSLLSNKLISYLFLVAVDYEDVAFANLLLLDRNISEFETDAGKIGLGRYYYLVGLFHKSINYLLPLFESDKLTNLDLERLFDASKTLARFKDADRVMQKALALYPENVGWKIIGLKYQIGISHLYPRNVELIQNNLKYLYSRCSTSDEYLVLAICFYLAGNAAAGLKLLNKSLLLMEVGAKAKSQSLEFDPEVCLDAMNRLIDLLQQKNITAFPAFGSLLGLYRDGRLMKYDKDADIGIFIDEVGNITELVRSLCLEGGFAAPMMVTHSPASHRWNVAMIDPLTGAAVDIFFFHRTADCVESGVFTPGPLLKWKFAPFQLKKTLMAGREYMAPADIESHLHALYGDNWSKPVAVWDSLVNCPNIPKESAHAVGFWGMQRLYKAIKAKNLKKIENYLGELTIRWPGLLEAPVVEKIEGIKGQIEVEETKED